MRQVTLASLRLQAQRRADMENSQFIQTSEWADLINASATELYDLLVTVYEDYYLKTSTLTTDGINDTYPLPGDFYKLLGVDEVLTSSQSVTCKPFQFSERNSYAPMKQAGRTLALQYIPALQPLVNDSDTLDGVNGFEEYVVIDAAIKALTKEEGDTSKLEQAKSIVIKRIQGMAPNRDAGQPMRVVDVSRSDPFMEFFVTTSLRYHLQGQNIRLVSFQAALGAI